MFDKFIHRTEQLSFVLADATALKEEDGIGDFVVASRTVTDEISLITDGQPLSLPVSLPQVLKDALFKDAGIKTAERLLFAL